MKVKFMKFGRMAVLSLALIGGSMAVNPVMAQDQVDTPAVEQNDEGFDDWGLLGLLGLAGLAGLLKRPERETRPADRPADTRR